MHSRAAARTTCAAAALLVPLFFAPTFARAQPHDVAAARDAYDRGAAAYDAGEYALAAQQLQKADAIVANDVALELALKAAVKANDALLAMELAGRADGRQSPAVLAARDDARSKMGSRTGRVTVTCPNGTTTCTSTFDDAAFPVGRPRWVLVGDHRVVITDASGGRQAFKVHIEPSASVDVVAQSGPAPLASPSRFGAMSPTSAAATTDRNSDRPTPTAPSSDRHGGISPFWFWLGTGVSVVVGAATIASAADTQNKHDRFVAQPSQNLSDDGFDAQLRTNLLLAGTTASVLLTAATGLFFVKWGGAGSSSGSGSGGSGGSGAGSGARSER